MRIVFLLLKCWAEGRGVKVRHFNGDQPASPFLPRSPEAAQRSQAYHAIVESSDEAVEDLAGEPSVLEDGCEGAQAPLMSVADTLVRHVQCRARVAIEDLAAPLQMSVKTLRTRLQAVAEASLQNQAEVQEALVAYIKRLQVAKLATPVLWLQHIIFDETPLMASLAYSPGVAEHVERTRLFVIESGYTMLFRCKQVSVADPVSAGEHGRALDDDHYFCITGQHSKSIQAAERCTGEGIAAVLRAVSRVPRAATEFKHHIHLSECDELAANGRGLSILLADMEDSWVPSTCHCVAHKIHAGCEKLWEAPRISPLVSAVLHMGLFMQGAGAKHALDKAMEAEIAARPIRMSTTCLASAEATRFRNHMVALFAPNSCDHPERHAMLTTVSTYLLNGDWRHRSELQHHCTSANCCRDEGHLRSKILQAMRQMMRACPIQLLQRNNWKDWMSGFRGPAMLDACHGLLSSSFERAFGGVRASLDCSVGQDVAQEEGEGQADPSSVNYERLRRERLEHQAAALQLVRSSGWLEDVVLLCQCLAPEADLMRSFLATTSTAHELACQSQLFSSAERPFRAEQLHHGALFQRMQRQSLQSFTDGSLWEEMVDTEKFRSALIIAVFRAASVVFQLLCTRWKSFPYKLLSLISNPSRENAQEILSSSPCLHDPLTKHILSHFNSVELLTSSQELRQVLCCIAQRLMTTTFTTERTHSSNARRKRATPHSRLKSISQLAMPHAAYGAPYWLRSDGKHGRVSKPLRPGRHKKKKAQSSSAGEIPVPPQRRGGGGPWRAYVHDMIANHKAPNDFHLLRAGYHNLSQIEREHYITLGLSG